GRVLFRSKRATRQPGRQRDDRRPGGTARARTVAGPDRREARPSPGSARPKKRKPSAARPPRAPRESGEAAADRSADGVRLQKLLSAAGRASRRASAQFILEGRR